MLTYSTHKLLTSLTKLDPKGRKDALKLNRAIMGYMGEKRSYASADLCVEVAAAGLASAELRMEIFCQLMKQLNGNPNAESKHKGWTLLLMCLLTFPAGPQLENYLHIFIRNHAPDDLKAVLKQQTHKISYVDQLQSDPPTLDNLQAAYERAIAGANTRNSFHRRCSFNR